MKKDGASKNLQRSIEYWVPKAGLDIEWYLKHEIRQGIHHIGRYTWAIPVVKKRKRILDIACGVGYGSKMIADAHPNSSVVGVDYDERAIAYAREHYNAPNLTFVVGNLVKWSDNSSSQLGKFDCVVSFDTIEHLLHREIALINFAENLRADGMLLFSTPCGQAETRLNPDWEHHKIEYSYLTLYKLLNRFFSLILHSENRTLPNQEFWDSVINVGEQRYLNRMNPVVCLEPIQIDQHIDMPINQKTKRDMHPGAIIRKLRKLLLKSC